MMYWILTKEHARDTWLLTGWAIGGPGARDEKITPYIEWPTADEAKLAAFLRANGNTITTSQPETALWMVANGLKRG